MKNNPILDELHAVREKLLADAGGTLDDLVNRLQAEERNSDRPRFEPRKPVKDENGVKSDAFAAQKQSLPRP